MERSPGRSHVGPEGRQHQAPGRGGGDAPAPGADAQGEPEPWSAAGADLRWTKMVDGMVDGMRVDDG